MLQQENSSHPSPLDKSQLEQSADSPFPTRRRSSFSASSPLIPTSPDPFGIRVWGCVAEHASSVDDSTPVNSQHNAATEDNEGNDLIFAIELDATATTANKPEPVNVSTYTEGKIDFWLAQNDDRKTQLVNPTESPAHTK